MERRVSIKRIYQSYRVIFRVALLPSELFIIFIACVFVLGILPQPTGFGISYLSSGYVIFEDSCYLRAFVKSSKWTASWKSSCWFDFYCNVTVLLGLKAANGFWISLLFLPGSCYNVYSFEILGFTRALACVGTDVPPPSSLALLLIFSVGGGTLVHGSLVSTRYSFPDTRWTEEIN